MFLLRIFYMNCPGMCTTCKLDSDKIIANTCRKSVSLKLELSEYETCMKCENPINTSEVAMGNNIELEKCVLTMNFCQEVSH